MLVLEVPKREWTLSFNQLGKTLLGDRCVGSTICHTLMRKDAPTHAQIVPTKEGLTWDFLTLRWYKSDVHLEKEDWRADLYSC